MGDNAKYVYAYGWNRFNMGVIGVWPEPNEGFLLRHRAWAYSLLIFVLIWIPQFASVSVFWGNINETIECLSTNVPVGVSVMKLVVFRYQRKVLSSLLQLVEEDWTLPWTKEQEETMMIPTRISRIISLLSVTVTSGLLVAYVASGIWFGYQNFNNPNIDPRLSIGFLYSAVFPYDTKKMKWFIPTWIGQLAGTWFSMIAYSGPDAFVAMLVLHLCGQLAVVRLNLKNIVDKSESIDPIVFRAKLKSIVERHEELNRRNAMIEDAFNAMLLAQMLVCTITFCFQGFAMFSTVMDPREGGFPILGMTFFVLHAIYTIMHLFVYCWVGDVLIVESTDIGFSPYESNWYLLNPAEIRALMFVTHRSRTPLQITAGKFCCFSLEMFTSIMKTSMGYLSVLLAMKDRLLE
uniref:Odorant receptor n=1 Tax=Campoletis chlorideae TaxID=219166 RepID=A0A346D3Z8_9HYME|nr:odorant receptor [Campoletis chlorideae]